MPGEQTSAPWTDASTQQHHDQTHPHHNSPPPPPPDPSADPALDASSSTLSSYHAQTSTMPAATTSAAGSDGNSNQQEDRLADLAPTDALRLLAASIELLVRMTGDVPPTPPPKTPTNPQMSDMQAEKENIARSHSEKNMTRMRQQAQITIVKEALRQRPQHQYQAPQFGSGTAPAAVARGGPPVNPGMNRVQAYSAGLSAQLLVQQQQASITGGDGGSSGGSFGSEPQEIDGVRLRKSPSAISPPAINSHGEPEPYIIIGQDSQPLNLQHGAITRKFYSKNEPPITVKQYLLRLHQFCPMSTAVYLAASLYIHRLAVEERAIPVTRRNAHRLVLAGLRVAMKALEDLSYPHSKISKVGGVSEAELARLEISFCFLAGFDLVVREESLRSHWIVLRDGRASELLDRMEGVKELKLDGRRRKNVVTPSG